MGILIRQGILLILIFSALSCCGLQCISCTSFPMAGDFPDSSCLDPYNYHGSHSQECRNETSYAVIGNSLREEEDSVDPYGFACIKWTMLTDFGRLIKRQCVPNIAGAVKDYCLDLYDDQEYCYCFGPNCNNTPKEDFKFALFLIPLLLTVYSHMS